MRVLVALLAVIWTGTAQGACRQALALGLDVSGSVDMREYRLQLDGLAGALLRADVQDAFLALPDAPVHLLVYEWSGLGSQRVLLAWTPVTSRDDLARIAGTLATTPRVAAEPPTAIGQAMLAGARRLAERPDCWRRTLDLTGDGKSNTGPRPRDLKHHPLLSGITINALVIGSAPLAIGDRRPAETADLWAYFRIEVIRGPQAFVEVAQGFEDFENAMARKLLKELSSLAVSEAPRMPLHVRIAQD
ncbi:MAG: DUF1194 domain-containing protein [Rhodobacter sp.]|nr:DUF1194 domain-containing protein [Rhodobacter sp.]